MAVASLQDDDASEQASQPSLIRILVGDELGQLRVCQAPTDKLSSLTTVDSWAQPDRSRGIESLAVDTTGQAGIPVYLASGLADGTIEIRDTAGGAVAGCIEASTSILEEEGRKIRGLHFVTVPSSESSRSLLLVSCTRSGLIQIHKRPEFGSTRNWPLESSWQGPSNILATAIDHDTSSLAFACKGSELSIWSFIKGEPMYLAKGAKPSNIRLMDPPWNTAVAFLPGTNGSQLVVGTGMHKVRLYNTEQKRPVMSVDFGESRLTALAPHSNGEQCWIADSHGQIGCLDFKLAKVQLSLKGVAGSVRSLTILEKANVILSVGLDRYLRLHDLATRKPLARVYLKHHLVGAVICPEPVPVTADAIDAATEATEDQRRKEMPKAKKKRRKKHAKEEGLVLGKKSKVSAAS